MPIVPINEDERAASAKKLGLTNALPGIDSIPISASQASPGAQNIVGQDDPAKYVIPQVSVDSFPKPAEPSAPSFLDEIPDLQGPADDRAVATGAPDFLADIPDVQTKTEQSYAEASQNDAARNAKVLKYSQQFGQPPEFIDKNMEHADKAASAPGASFFQEMETQYPGSTKFYAKPENMAVAHDDIHNVVEHEGLVKKVTEAHGLWDSFKMGLEGSVAGDVITGGKPSMEPAKDQSTPEWLAQQAGAIIPDLPVMGVGGLVGGLTGSAVAPGPGTIIGAGAGGFGAPTAVHEVLKQYRKGEIKDFRDAVSRIWEIEKATGKSAAIGAATGVAALATAGMGPLVALTAEVGTMTAAGKMVEEGTVNPNDLLDYLSGNDVGKDMAQNALLIGGMHAVSALPGKAKEHVVAEQKTRAAKEFYTSLGDTAEASKLRERMPEAHRDLVENLVKDTPVEHIYLPVEEATAYFQSKGIKIEDVAAQMGIGESLAEAKATGGDIKIPLATWVDKVVGTEHYKGLENDIKFHPEDVSFNQATAIRSEITAQVQEAAKQASENAPLPEVDNKGQAVEAAGKIYQDLQVKLKAAGLSADEARYNPKVHEAFFTTIAKRINESLPAESQIDPFELQQRFPLEVNRLDAPAARGAQAAGGQVKEASQGAGQAREFNQDQSKPAEKAPPFYSKLTRTVEEKMGGSASVEQINGMIREIKPEERKWMGIDEFLKGKEKVSKQDLLDHLRGNAVEIKEVTKGDNTAEIQGLPSYKAYLDELMASRDLTPEEAQKYAVGAAEGTHGGAGEPKAAASLRKEFIEKHGYERATPKYSQYTMPGGEKYREVLFTLPVKAEGNANDFMGWASEKYGDKFLDFSDSKLKELENQYKHEKTLSALDNSYHSSHFQEPNVLAHTRLNDRVDAEGKKVLFVEEIQSDWHQDGRKKGYKGEAKPEVVGHRVFFDWAEDGKKGRLAQDYKTKEEAQSALDTAKERRGADNKNWRIEDILSKPDESSAVPDAPFRKNWHEFVLKRLIREAAEKGYDKVAWTTGEQQADRYDLAKQVDEVKAKKNKDGTYAIKTIKDGETLHDVKSIQEKDLESQFGKDLSTKIVADGSGRSKSYKGVDLKVGGEGMKGFYDKILPDFANKFAKKYGAKVSETSIDAGGFSGSKEDFENGSGHIIHEKVHSLEITPELRKAALDEGFSLFQGGDETPRGQIRINGREFNIDLFKDKDKSTFLHESGHFFLEVMGHVVEGEGKGSEQIQKDYSAILKFLDVHSRDEIKVEQHEKFARAFEEYLASGEAPSLQLRDAFVRFRKWLTDLWKKVSFSKVEVSPEIREVFDRMMAADDEIAQARRHLNMEEEFKIDGMDEVSAKNLKDLQEKARARAEEVLLKDKLKETKAEYKDKLETEREKFKVEAEEQVKNEPLFQAVENLRESGRDPYEMANEALRGELTPEQSVQFELLADEHGFTTAEELAHAIADAGANKTFDGLVNQIVDQNLQRVGMIKDAATLREDAIRAIHSEQMTELLALEREALSDLHHKAEITGEARRRNRIVAKVEAAAANAEAKRILSLKAASEAGRPQIYITQERNAAARVAKFMAKKEYDKAAKAKQEQMVAHALVRESFKIGEEVEKHENYIKQFSNRGLSLMDMPYGFIRQVDSLLSSFGYQGARGEDGATQAKIAEMMSNDGRDPHEIANATGFIESESGSWVPEPLPQFVARQNDNYHAIQIADSVLRATQVDHNTLTLPELRDLREAVETIVSSGRKNDRFLNEFIKVDAKAAAKELRASIEEKIGKPHEKDFEIGSGNEHGVGAALKSILNFPDAVIPSMVNMETLVNFLDRGDPNGPARRYLYRPMADAENRKQVRHDEAIKEMNAILEKHYKPEELATYKTEKRLAVKGFPDALTKENVLAMALNWGNETNRDRVRRGYKIDDNAVQAAFEVLDKRDWDFVQDSWNYLDSYWPEIKKLEMKVKGIEPRKVSASKVVTKHGVYEGGYYPIAYDHMKSAEAFQMQEQRSELYKQFSAVSAHTERGHAEARVNKVSRPVRLSLGVMFDHLENVIHDLSYRESVIDVNRMLRDYDVKGGVQNAVGLKGFRMMDQWLKDIASDQRGSLQDGEQLLKWFRMKATMSTLGFRAFTLPMDITGNIITSMHEIGPMRTMKAIGDHVLGRGEGKEFVEANSTYMEQRGKTMDRDLADLNRRWTLEKPVLDRVASKITGKDIGLRNFAFFFQRFADDAVAVPLWNEVYKNSLGKFEHRDAVHMADEAIKRTMGSGSHIDLVGVQKGSEKAKIMSMFYSWSSMMFNRAWSEGKIAGLEYREGNYLPALAVAARGAFFLWGLHALNETLWRELFYNARNGNANQDDRKKRIVGRVIQQPFSYLWLGRDIAGLAIDKATGQTGSFRLSPVESAIESVVSPPAKAVYFAFSDHKKFDQKFVEESARAAALMAGSPQTLNAMAFNFIDWTNNQGQATWRDALSRRHKK